MALKHCELPSIARLVQAKDVEIPVVAPDFEVAVVRPRPPIDVFNDFDAAPIQTKALRVPDTVIVAIDLYQHGLIRFTATPPLAALVRRPRRTPTAAFMSQRTAGSEHR